MLSEYRDPSAPTYFRLKIANRMIVAEATRPLGPRRFNTIKREGALPA